MNAPLLEDITILLNAWKRGDELAGERLASLLYQELRRMAEHYLHSERGDHTLQPTALVHEAWLRLSNGSGANWESRLHFFGASARVMREVLVDYARARNRLKRGGGLTCISLDEALGQEIKLSIEVIKLNDALHDLGKFAPRQYQIIELRFFGGLTIEEIASLLGWSPATVKREMRSARAWLYQEISGQPYETEEPSQPARGDDA